MAPPLFHSIWNKYTIFYIVSYLPQWDIPFCKSKWKSGGAILKVSSMVILRGYKFRNQLGQGGACLSRWRRLGYLHLHHVNYLSISHNICVHYRTKSILKLCTWSHTVILCPFWATTIPVPLLQPASRESQCLLHRTGSLTDPKRRSLFWATKNKELNARLTRRGQHTVNIVSCRDKCHGMCNKNLTYK